MNAQEHRVIVVDSLKDKTIPELINLIKNSSTDKSLIYEVALNEYKTPNTNLARIYSEIGYYFYKEENSERSVSYLDKAIKIASTNGDNEILCEAYKKQGNSYLQDWKNQEALDAYQKVLEMSHEKADLKNEIVAKSNIVIVLRRMNQLDRALRECNELLSFIDETSFKNGRNHVNVLTIISEVYLDLEKFDSVIKYADKGIKMSKLLDYQIAIADLYIKKGIVFYQSKDFDQALDFLYKAEDILENLKISKRSNQSINVNYFLASYFYEIKSYDKAINYLLETINALKDGDLRKNRVIDAHVLLAKSYKEMGDGDASIHWFTRHQELQDQFQKNKDKTVNKLYDQNTQQLGDKIKTLESKQVKEQKYKKYILGSLVLVFLIMIAVLITYFRKQKSNKIVFNELVKKISDLETREKIESSVTKDVTKEVVIDDGKISEVLKGLHKIEQQEYFLSLDCNLRSIAKKVKTNATYLSKIINTYKGKSFNDYINDLRIDYALKRLKNDKKFRSFSISSIASEIGYKSDNSFTKHFKAKTGLNPSYYIKNIDKLPYEIKDI
ncbi:AraC-type DNA-binding protein [Aquimarina amphilecti]|uniref:AraC-type DNA-binding protein n=1 Tax=Aquimarina amphilecti TaxID=1038014 RepID=A0A1H7J714_AQUAM|nr:helix-turn-helix domain-containing protein [Aquimarina amphilecti]SEK69760.1 AraC-type DNA-binding protein [Aquimarina amphilecti]